MSDKDSFPFWTDEWMSSQQAYRDAWLKLAEQNPSEAGSNPWIDALQTWQSLIPHEGDSQAYAQHLLAQGKAFFHMAEEIRNFLLSLQESDKTGDGWQQNLESQFEKIKERFHNQQADFSAFWDKNFISWQQAGAKFDPESLFKSDQSQQIFNTANAQLAQQLNIPPVGPDREKYEQQQRYLNLWTSFQEALGEYNLAHQHIGYETTERLLAKLIELSNNGETLDSMREVYDLWVDCAEDAYAAYAHTDEFQLIYGNMVNSLMALKRENKNILDQQMTELGLPGAKAFDTVLKRMQDMRRQIRSLQASQKTSSEFEDLHQQISQLREEITELRQQSTKSNTSATIIKPTKKKAATTRKKVAKKKVSKKKVTKKKPLSPSKKKVSSTRKKVAKKKVSKKKSRG